METLTEPSIAPELRSGSLIPTSPDEERSVDHHHNNNNDDDEDVDLHPSNLLEEQSQSSQDSSSLVSPPPEGGGGDAPEETIENIARELQHSNASSDSTCNDNTNDSQPEPERDNTDSSSTPPEQNESPSAELQPEAAAAIAVAPIPKVHIAPISNGSLALKSSGKPTTMRDLDRKMNKSSRGRSKRTAKVAMYQSEVRIHCVILIKVTGTIKAEEFCPINMLHTND